jgi:hypothetical protein
LALYQANEVGDEDGSVTFCGKKKINIFMLSIAYEGQAIPIFWKLLDKAGNSNLEERKGLQRFPKTRNRCKRFQTPQYTFFRYGLNFIREAIFQVAQSPDKIMKCL